MAKHNEIGEIGERVAAKYLEKEGFKIIDRNYRKKWGEIDIVAFKDSKVYFVEVKTVSRSTVNGKFEEKLNDYRPEDNMHPWKVKRLQRAIQTYILEKFKKTDPLWQFDLICVFLDRDRKIAKIRYIKDLVL